MVMLSTFEKQHRAAAVSLPDTPPELVSPSSSTYSAVPSEDHSTWRTGPPSPPMSSHDQQRPATSGDMSRRGSDETHSRKGTAASLQSSGSSISQRQQLPSLSSLFPPTLRPLHSPLSERPPHYQATSPLDPPCSAGAYQEGSESSYFPPAGSSSSGCNTTTHHQPRTVYEPKLYDRNAAAYSGHPRPAFPGPLSPGSRELDHHRRPESSSRWSAHQEFGRSSEYSIGGRDQLARYPPPPRPLAGTKHDYDGYASSYRDPRTSSQHLYQQQQQQQPQPQHQQQPYSQHASQNPAPGVGGESKPTKDGLGPKIWTGTHFLPRFVRAAELPGEGMCYFYDDGSHCKTVIDGEAVNAHWGVTKAGKPRKRLAIACVTCREKKIKCDPDYPRCVQCEKFGRVCRFKNAPRGGGHGNTSPSTSTTERDESPSRQRPYDLPRSARRSESVSPRTTHPPLMGLTGPPKRTKYWFDTNSAPPGLSGGREYGQGPAQSSWQQQPPPPQQQQQQQQGHSAPQLPLPRMHDDMYRRRDQELR